MIRASYKDRGRTFFHTPAPTVRNVYKGVLSFWNNGGCCRRISFVFHWDFVSLICSHHQSFHLMAIVRVQCSFEQCPNIGLSHTEHDVDFQCLDMLSLDQNRLKSLKWKARLFLLGAHFQVKLIFFDSPLINLNLPECFHLFLTLFSCILFLLLLSHFSFLYNFLHMVNSHAKGQLFRFSTL